MKYVLLEKILLACNYLYRRPGFQLISCQKDLYLEAAAHTQVVVARTRAAADRTLAVVVRSLRRRYCHTLTLEVALRRNWVLVAELRIVQELALGLQKEQVGPSRKGWFLQLEVVPVQPRMGLGLRMN